MCCWTSTDRFSSWTRRVATGVPVSPEKPHGLDYSPTMHGPDGKRLVGFDNANPVARQKRGGRRIIVTYCRRSGRTSTGTRATLLADFWETVDAARRERGVIP
jgi:hypothetical protein